MRNGIFHHRVHISLRARATLFVLLVVSLGLAAPASVMINSLRQQIIEEERRAASAMARAAAEAVVLPLAVGDHEELQRLAKHFLWDGHTLFVAIYDETGRLVTHAESDGDAWRRYIDAGGPLADGDWFLGQRAIVFESDADAFGGFGFNEPAPTSERLAVRTIGQVVTAISPDRAKRALAQKTAVAAWIVAIGWLGTAPLVWLVVRQWSSRLDRLVGASERISAGDLATEIDDPRPDDIGRLSQALEGMRCALRDREQELRTFNDRLQQEVAEQTRDLDEARRAAEEANRAKSAFLANMSHEIRTPLTAILGYIDLMEDEHRSPDDQREQIETIRRNARHLLAIINDILDISKIEAGELLVERIETNPAAIIGEALSMMRPAAHDRGLDLELEFRSPVPAHISTDPTRLRQIVLNLVSNAVKFTDQGWVRVAVSCDPATRRLCVEVADSGSGMPASTLERLFRPFSQADETMTRRFGGTGLGLAISRQLARALGGDVRVESTLGIGSTFTVEVDTGALDGVAMVTPSEALLPDQGEGQQSDGPDAEGARVLLVEDGPDNRRLIGFLLTRAGCTVETAENGLLGLEAALEAQASGTPFDVVVLDMQMPVMDGYTAAQSLRSCGYPGWIVALTAHAMSQDCQKCLNAGCDEYLAKPVDRQSLIETIARLRATRRHAA